MICSLGDHEYKVPGIVLSWRLYTTLRKNAGVPPVEVGAAPGADSFPSKAICPQSLGTEKDLVLTSFGACAPGARRPLKAGRGLVLLSDAILFLGSLPAWVHLPPFSVPLLSAPPPDPGSQDSRDTAPALRAPPPPPSPPSGSNFRGRVPPKAPQLRLVSLEPPAAGA